MKRLFISLLLLVPVMTFAGCGAGDDSSEIDIPEVPNDPGNDDDDNDNSGTVTPGNGKILIAWFSRWGNTNYAADVDATTGASILVDKERVVVRPKWSPAISKRLWAETCI